MNLTITRNTARKFSSTVILSSLMPEKTNLHRSCIFMNEVWNVLEWKSNHSIHDVLLFCLLFTLFNSGIFAPTVTTDIT